MTESMTMKTKIIYSISGLWEIWTDVNALKVLYQFKGIEWVNEVGRNHYVAQLDPRYEWEVLVEEIKEALEAELEGQK